MKQLTKIIKILTLITYISLNSSDQGGAAANIRAKDRNYLGIIHIDYSADPYYPTRTTRNYKIILEGLPYQLYVSGKEDGIFVNLNNKRIKIYPGGATSKDIHRCIRLGNSLADKPENKEQNIIAKCYLMDAKKIRTIQKSLKEKLKDLPPVLEDEALEKLINEKIKQRNNQREKEYPNLYKPRIVKPRGLNPPTYTQLPGAWKSL